MGFDPAQPTVTVCRGCCCGTIQKHPGITNAEHLDRLRRALRGRADVRVSDCLGPCERSNVVVVSPSRQGRLDGGRPAWFGFVLGEDAIDDLAGWVAAGGPGVAVPPATLDLHCIGRP